MYIHLGLDRGLKRNEALLAYTSFTAFVFWNLLKKLLWKLFMKAPAIRSILLNSFDAAIIRLAAYRAIHRQQAPFHKETAPFAAREGAVSHVLSCGKAILRMHLAQISR